MINLLFVLFLNLLQAAPEDPHLFLEQVESKEALTWVEAENKKSLDHFTGLDLYKNLEKEIKTILQSPERLKSPNLMGQYIYNFWQDAEHKRGIWRRTSIADFNAGLENWQTILDVDALATKENENWVWKGADCLEPAYERCLLNLSRGGKDAVVVREYLPNKAEFLAGGFSLPEAKQTLAWRGENALLVATDFGKGTLTTSGYPRIVKLLQRGQALADATFLYEGKTDDVAVRPSSFNGSAEDSLIIRSVSFFEQEYYWVMKDNSVKALVVPKALEVSSYVQGQIIGVLREDTFTESDRFPSGTLVSIPRESALNGTRKFEAIYTPDSRSAVAGGIETKSAYVFGVLDNVKSRVLQAKRLKGHWVVKEVDLPKDGTLEFVSSDSSTDTYYAKYESFLTPPTLYFVDKKSTQIAQLKPVFDASPYVMEQKSTKSKDGTEIPYFLVRKKGIPHNGKNPTLLYGYGGFNLAQKPTYMNSTGKVWLERGGVYVLANIRGGGEFGPRWHQAAIKENRQRAYDDFIAVAEDLVSSKITSPKHLGIRGGSNGGLLMGVMLTQRPDLFNAIVCQVPLLDMLRFHKLLAGASWMGEYGNPEIAAEREYISKYSPYQNLKAGVAYPKTFFLTSTKDDRVHPGHARKMAAQMRTLNQDLYYYENTEGGHGGAANIEQQARVSALYFSYLFERIGN